MKESQRRKNEKNPLKPRTHFHATPDPVYVKPKDLSPKLKKLMLIIDD
ncbi:MAG: hypothetical protein Athens101426_202 [Parcubacteria group bacterium Athens1014_26]|nr:MAG: hypothetical protein Athens101426_202 [Parcubacteria group bacterium Athens1014_26]